MQRCMVESGQPAIKKSIVQPKDIIHGDLTNTKIAVIKIKKNVSYIFYTYMAYKYLAQ